MSLTARETILVDAIADKLHSAFPTPDSKRSGPPVADNNGGQYRALQSDIESVRSDFHDFKTDVNLRFSEISTGIKGLEQAIGRISPILASSSSGGEGKGLGGGGLASILGVAAILLTIAGAFGTIVKMNIDTNVAYAQERTTVAEKHLGDDLGGVAQIVKRLEETTVPRAELDIRINGNRDALKEIVKVQDTHSSQIATAIADASNLKADVERLKGEIVTRRENEGHWEDFQNRLNLFSSRLTDLAKGGGK